MARSARPQLTRDFVLEHKRVRIMEGAARSVYALGVSRSRIPELVAEGEVSRKTFYEIFGGEGGKDRCLKQTLSWVWGQILHDAAQTQTIREGIAAVLDFAAEHPDRACLYLIYGPSISLGSHEEGLEAFADLLDHDTFDEPARRMVVGGIADVLRRQLFSSDVDPRLLLNSLTDFAESFAADRAPLEVAA
jgi:hypothetical protein